jgi:hypothetical protein
MKYIATKFTYDEPLGEPSHSIELTTKGSEGYDEDAQEIQTLYEFEAATWEEAMAIHHLRMGWGPYNPRCNAEECPQCKAVYYPEGSGQCWRCSYGHSDGTKAT